jgi:hypothetical protein
MQAFAASPSSRTRQLYKDGMAKAYQVKQALRLVERHNLEVDPRE